MSSEIAELTAKYNNRIYNLLQTLGVIFGYDIGVQNSEIQLRSKYAFNEEDVILLRIAPTEGEEHKAAIEVRGLNGEYLRKFEKEKKMYLEKESSIPAFLSAVTLSLFEQNTFQ